MEKEQLKKMILDSMKAKGCAADEAMVDHYYDVIIELKAHIIDNLNK